jgi:general stress protein 26
MDLACMTLRGTESANSVFWWRSRREIHKLGVSIMDLADVAKALKDIDFVMFSSHTEGGKIASRPMSNNREVEFDGDSWFFVDQSALLFEDVRKNPEVTLNAQGSKGLLGKPPLFLAIEGRTEVILDKAVIADHWQSDLKRWWPDGPDSPGIALLKVHASRIHYWAGEDEGEVAGLS